MTRPRPISTRVHGVLDYLTGASLMLAPRVLGLQGTTSGRLLAVLGANHAGYSLITDYELGVKRLVPMPVHLAADGVGAVALAAAPWALGSARQGRRHWLPHLVFGLYELGTVALSQSEPRG